MLHHSKEYEKLHLSKFRSRKYSCVNTASNSSWAHNSRIPWTMRTLPMAWIYRTTMCQLLGQMCKMVKHSKTLVQVADLLGRVLAASTRMNKRQLWVRAQHRHPWTLLCLSKGQMMTSVRVQREQRFLLKCQRICNRWWKRWRVSCTRSALESKKRLDVPSFKPSLQLSAIKLMLTLYSTTWPAKEALLKLKAAL